MTDQTAAARVPEREADIRARRTRMTDSPWGSSRDLDGRCTVQAGAYVALADGFTSTGTVAHIDGSSEQERGRRADFIARAPGDIDALLSEIDRLRGELAAIHRPYSDSPHCVHDGERWPCPTMRVASGGDGAR